MDTEKIIMDIKNNKTNGENWKTHFVVAWWAHMFNDVENIARKFGRMSYENFTILYCMIDPTAIFFMNERQFSEWYDVLESYDRVFAEYKIYEANKFLTNF